MSEKAIEIGRLLRAGTTGFVVGCRAGRLEALSFGALVRAPVEPNYIIYGLIYDIHIDDDGLVRQLVTADGVDDGIISDNRANRNVPLEMSVLALGYQKDGRISHLLPPRPPLSLDVIYLCDPSDLCGFTAAGRFGYFRHVLRANDIPIGELLAAHIQQSQEAHQAVGQADWVGRATQEIITLLRDDYAMLAQVLGALADINSFPVR
ncbi:MAG TPA: hypothetical protein VLS48_01870 [Anaerolineales bacterium]|nr:hypothetical protein [Anaerolineales bacterium]